MKYLNILFLVIFLHAADVIIKDEECTINWTRYTLTCIGTSEKSQSKYAAYTSAKIIAQRNLLQYLKGVKITSTTTIENGMLKSDIIKATVKGVVKGARVVKIQEFGDYVKATVMAPLNGSILNVVYPYDDMQNIKALLNKKYNIFVSEKIVSNNDEIIKSILLRLDKIEKKLFFADDNKNTKITGVIIDARNTNFIPTLSPKIYKIITNTPLYPDGVVDKETIANSFVALYVNSLDDAIKHPKVGDKPLVIKALRTYGKWRDKLILSTSATKKFKKLLTTDVLKNARVVIVISKDH